VRIVNPGALGGLRKEPRSFCIVDLDAVMWNLSQCRLLEMMDYDTLCAYLLQKPGSRRDMPFGPDVLVLKF
jgi:hypothetical protein